MEQVEQAFRIGCKRFSRYVHYFSHIKAAWYTLGREDISVMAVRSWLNSEEAVEVRKR